MEGNKQKKTRDVGFENVKDPSIKAELIKLTGCPADATNFIFWYSKINNEEWGLTLKSIPKKGESSGFTSQHTWKLTWFYKPETNSLCAASHCKSLASDVFDDRFQRINDIYKSYRK
jgi:hypothetical protein